MPPDFYLVFYPVYYWCKMNKKEWFELLEKNKDALRDIVECYHPVNLDPNKEYDGISAPGAENACKQIREEIKKENPVVNFDKALEEQDGYALYIMMNAAWFGMPESHSSRDVKGFYVLCDLLSDMYEEEE